MIKKLFKLYSLRNRKKRAKIFIENLRPSENDKILDLGAQDGSHMASVIPYRKNVFIADLNASGLEEGKKAYGFNTILLDGSDTLPFPDKFFDIVFCSSVIEHVTVDKKDFAAFSSNSFREESYKTQRKFANEIRRVAKRYYVQTPYKHFPIESHTWLPSIIVYMPRGLQIKIIRFMNKFWPVKSSAHFNLLTKKEMSEFFPDAEIIAEKSFFLTKSIMAIKK